jgi:hypothetical protein
VGLVPANGSVIMPEMQYTYNSPVNVVVKNALTFNNTFPVAAAGHGDPGAGLDRMHRQQLTAS